ncbi:hypothetical protein [Campylobacter sp. RM16192]|uniref:hypothetical protein n=1 Tax=Campylobacter sp. RM16192 TaxID=1660080 RepID=UPI001451513F|nr:hypothetical protein [Campylobacter sp. RM16192]QCD52807.1 hypothetical protein CDOMC_1200 [Campylobacter sp. RM16192]
MKYFLSIALCLYLTGCAAHEQEDFLRTSLNTLDRDFSGENNAQNGLIAGSILLGINLLSDAADFIAKKVNSSDDEAVNVDLNTTTSTDHNATLP